MKKVLLKTVLICWGCGLFTVAAGDDRLITVDMQKTPYIMGKPIQMTVNFKNNGTNDWTLAAPENSLSLNVYYARIGDPENPGVHNMGRIESVYHPEGGFTAFTAPEPEYIVIKAGEQYSFSTDIYVFLLGYIFPGKWIIWVREAVKSEPAEFQIVFTKESVDILLDTAKNSDLDSFRRHMHTKWLRELKTDIPKFKWPGYKDSSEEKSRKEAAAQKYLKEFEDFWNKEKNSPDTEKAVERIDKICREIAGSSSPFRLNCPDILEFRR